MKRRVTRRPGLPRMVPITQDVSSSPNSKKTWVIPLLQDLCSVNDSTGTISFLRSTYYGHYEVICLIKYCYFISSLKNTLFLLSPYSDSVLRIREEPYTLYFLFSLFDEAIPLMSKPSVLPVNVA